MVCVNNCSVSIDTGLRDTILPSADRERIRAVERCPSSEEKIKTGTRPHVANNSGNNEWYTPPKILDRVRAVLGSIDLDPASIEEANRVVGATKYYSADEDGLSKPWSGRIFMNPPYSQPLIWEFCKTLVDSYRSGDVTEAIVLVNNATETRWFQMLMEEASAVCLPKGRIRFWHPEKISSPLQGQVILYFGVNAYRFIEHFKDIGSVGYNV